jgi:hypothetical protein
MVGGGVKRREQEVPYVDLYSKDSRKTDMQNTRAHETTRPNKQD